MMYLVFFLVFVLSFGFVFVVRHYAPKLGLIDVPNDRSTHTSQTPRGAGIGFSLAVAFALSYFYGDILLNYLWVSVAIVLVFVMGIVDDYYDSTPYAKFTVFILATLFLSFDNLLIDNLGIYFGVELSLGWLALPFTIFAVVGFTNATNLIDGIDGLAATISVVILTTFYVLGTMHDDLFMMLFSGAFIASLLAFLLFNWTPASIFMGDSGSLTLGFVISVLAIKSLAYIPAISIFFIAAIPVMDTLIVMTRRKIHGKSMVTGDRCHIHHLVQFLFKGNTPKTVLVLSFIQIIYALIGVYLPDSIDNGYLLLLFIVNGIVLYRLLCVIVKKQRRDC